MNALYLRRRSRVLVPGPSGFTPIHVLASLQKNLESLGYLLSGEVLQRLAHLDPVEVEEFYHELVKQLQVLVGAHRAFEPLYPNFPRQVMRLSEAELYLNAIAHYWTLDRPDYPKEARPALEEQPVRRVIHLGSEEDLAGLFTLLLRSKSAFSSEDRTDLKWFVNHYRERLRELVPDTIPCKENLAAFAGELLRSGVAEAGAILDDHVKTATDVLRIAVALSEGDVSLAKAGKFGKFSRPVRVLLLGWIERTPSRTEDMLRWKPRWIRLGERLHPREYATRFPKTTVAFDILRNNRPYPTFHGQVEVALKQQNTPAALDLLQTRPGELARRLDHLARISKDAHPVTDRFAAHARDVSTPVLLQVLMHFQHRDQPAALRAFFPKGEVAKLFATEEPLPALAPGVAAAIVAICEQTLLERFSALEPLGKCYLDPRLQDYLVPFAQRSAAKALRTLVRGSRLPIPECRTLRFFVWWKNGTSRVDIDLSAAMYDTEYKYIDTLAYYNLKNFGAHHSGDITDAPNGAAEFIDIDLSRCLAQRVRYVVMCLNSYTQQPYCDLPECFAGWMARLMPNSGEIFEAKTVVDRVDVAANTRMCLPAIFDLDQRQVIWADIALSSNPHFPNNVANHLTGVSAMVRALTQLHKTDLYTLFDLHIQARGERVEAIDAAQTVFSVEQGITPFDLVRIGAEFM